METLTRLVSESLARHGFDRPLDYRRLQWSCWFRCESHHSLLSVPSKPGVFALAEEIVDFGLGSNHGASNAHVETGDSPVPRTLGEAKGSGAVPTLVGKYGINVEERRSSAPSGAQGNGASAPASSDAGSPKPEARRMLAVAKFFEDDDMAFVLDRMLSCENPMRARLNSGRYFVRYVVIEDPSQRRSIWAALNQWIVSSAEKATGIGAHFASSLELTEARVVAGDSPAKANAVPAHVRVDAEACPERSRVSRGGVERVRPERSESKGPYAPSSAAKSPPPAPHVDSGAATNIHCPSQFPSGF
jgi:hypothetical protein